MKELDQAINLYRDALKAHIEAKNATVEAQILERKTYQAVMSAKVELRELEGQMQIY